MLTASWYTLVKKFTATTFVVGQTEKTRSRTPNMLCRETSYSSTGAGNQKISRQRTAMGLAKEEMVLYIAA